MTLSPRFSELNLNDFDGQLTQTVILSKVRWQTYQAMLADMGDRPVPRTAYDRGTLILKMPSTLHEIINRLLARIVTTLTEELGLEVVNVGSTTLARADLARAVEPDTGFYIQNAPLLQGLDPQIPEHLPPDLVIEVDITSPSGRRLEIYEALGVSEVWQYTKQQGLTIYQLQAGSYVVCDRSAALPQVTVAWLNECLTQRQTQSENQVIRAVRSWVQPLT